jgi:hypothetical protein
MKKYGRPKFEASKCKASPVRTYVTEDTRAAILVAAHAQGITEAQWLRDAIRAKLGGVE